MVKVLASHNHLRGDIYAKEFDKLHAVLTDGQLSRHLAKAFLPGDHKSTSTIGWKLQVNGLV